MSLIIDSSKNRYQCDQCQLAVINSVPCHETGCPNQHVNPATQSHYEIECDWCGQYFEPVTTDDVFCSVDCEDAYHGML